MKWGCDLQSQGGNGLGEDLLRGGVGWGELDCLVLPRTPAGAAFPKAGHGDSMGLEHTFCTWSLYFLLQLHRPVAGGQLSSSERELGPWHPLLLFSAAPPPPLLSNPLSHPRCHSHDNFMLHFSLVASFHLLSTLFWSTQPSFPWG